MRVPLPAVSTGWKCIVSTTPMAAIRGRSAKADFIEGCTRMYLRVHIYTDVSRSECGFCCPPFQRAGNASFPRFRWLQFGASAVADLSEACTPVYISRRTKARCTRVYVSSSGWILARLPTVRAAQNASFPRRRWLQFGAGAQKRVSVTDVH
jgi:hypothetical protein